MDNKFKKWEKWLNVIYEEILTISEYRDIFKQVQDMVRENKRINKDNVFYNFLFDSYISFILMGIRRQIKNNKDSISFIRLLNEIIKNPEVLSRKRYVDLYKNSVIEFMADKNFDEFSGQGKDYIDPDLVKKDIEELEKKANKLEKYIDRKVAHIDKRGIKQIPKLKDADECVDLLEELLKKYYRIFFALILTTTIPVYQYDWKVIFKVPWISKQK